MLEYDNSAFYYFSFTFLAISIIPATYYTIKDVIAILNPSKKSENVARTSLEAEKAKRMSQEQNKAKQFSSWVFIARLVFLVVAVVAVLYLMQLIQSDDQIAQFNPYTILGLEPGVDDRTIKKAYRALSLEYHPDKNPGNQTALDIFLKVAKAYEALTDPIAKKNWEEFGNPDGKQALEVSIGLPTFLLDKQNHSYILIVYLLGMVVIIPSLVGLWYANSKQYGDKNVMYKTYSHFYQLLSENHRIKHMPETLAAAQEYFEINAPRLSEKEDLLRLYHKLKTKQMQKPKLENNPVILKGNCLLHAHVLRMTDQMPEKFQKDLQMMLRKSPELMDAIVDMCWQRQWLQTTLAALRFRQCLVQALWPSDAGTTSFSLLQIPHFTEHEVKHVTSGKGKASCKTLGQYLRIPEDQRKGLADMTEQQKADVQAVLALLPQIDIKTELFVEEDPEEADGVRGDLIAEKDLITLRVTITRTNLEEGQQAAPVHAPYFPVPLKERWWVLLTDKSERVHGAEKITSQDRVATATIRFLAPPKAGTYDLEVHVVSESYIGMDEVISLNFDVTPASELPEYKAHPEDLELDNEPTLFEQVMANAHADDSDSDAEAEAEAEAEADEAEPAGSDKDESDDKNDS